MRFILEPVSEPELEPVGLAQMKRELGEFASLTDRDDDIFDKIKSGREWVEDFTGRVMVDRSWRLTIDQGLGLLGDRVSGYRITRFSPGCYGGPFLWGGQVGEIMLRKSPVLAITSFESVDGDGVATTIDSSTYELREADSKWPRLVALSGATWTGAEALRATFRAGFVDRTGSPVQDISVLPGRFKQAIMLWVKANYDCEADEMGAYMKAAENLIRSERANLSLA